MVPRIATLPEKQLIGMRTAMSLAQNTTRKLWQRFMPRRKEIEFGTGAPLYSLQVYDPAYFARFDPAAAFVKWAALEVSQVAQLPEGMEAMVLPGGLYAVFIHKGAASTGAETFQYIFGQWLPGSDYQLDNRPHFELLGEKYKNDDPDSEEEIWIPIKPRTGAPGLSQG
jgi:AraC family transcriptional regulator